MAYYTFPPPFYSSSTPPFYATSTTIPVPSPNLNFNHGYTPPSPNPYSSHESPPNPCAYGSAGYPDYHRYYQQQPHHFYSQPQPPPPYSPSPPYRHHPPYQPIDVIQRSFDEILQISQGSVNEFTQISQKSRDNLRAIDEQLQASRRSIKASFQKMFELLAALPETSHVVLQEKLVEEDPQEPSEVLQEHVHEGLVEDAELVDDDPEKLPEENELLEVHEPLPKIVAHLAQTGTTISPEKWKSPRSTAGDNKSTNQVLKPPSTTTEFVFIHSLTASLPPDATPQPSPKPPDPSFKKADSTIPPPPPKPPDRSFLRMPVESQVIGEPIMPPPPPKPPDRKWVQLSHYNNHPTPLDSLHSKRTSLSTSGTSISRNVQAPKSLLGASAIATKFQPHDLLLSSNLRSLPLSESTIRVHRSPPTVVRHVSSSGLPISPHSRPHLIPLAVSHTFSATLFLTPATDSHVLISLSTTSPKLCLTPSERFAFHQSSHMRFMPFELQLINVVHAFCPTCLRDNGSQLLQQNRNSISQLITPAFSKEPHGNSSKSELNAPLGTHVCSLQCFIEVQSKPSGKIQIRVEHFNTITLGHLWCTLNYSIAIHLSSIKPSHLLPSSPIYLLLPTSPIRGSLMMLICSREFILKPPHFNFKTSHFSGKV